MRRTLLLTAVVLALGACSQDRSDPLEPADFDTFTADFTSVAYGMDGLVPGAGLHELWRLKNLPEAIKLTAEQEAAITKLLDDFQKAHEADLKELTRVLDEARKAIGAGKPRTEIAALFQQARTIRERMRSATVELKADIDAELTAQQKAWLATGLPARCYPVSVTGLTPLSAEQRTAIKALYEAHQAATAEDRAAVNAALEAARKARQQGKPRTEIQAILASVKDAMARLQAAGDELRADINAVLTPAQRASGCFGPAPRKAG